MVMNRKNTDSESLAYVLCEILISKGVYICFPTRSIHNITLNLPDECIRTKFRVAVNHVCFHLVTQF